MKLTMVSHASVLIDAGSVVLLTDPWFSGEVFNDSWSLLCPSFLSPSQLDAVTHIWISHEHPDHLHFPTLKAIPEHQKQRITLLYQRHFSRRVVNALERLGFKQVTEVPLGRWFDLTDDVSVLCQSVGTIDSLLAFKSNGKTVLNMNDCMMNATAARHLARQIGQVDVLLTQFSIANWVGNPGDTQIVDRAAVLNRARFYIRVFKPTVTIPFASFVYFSHEENRHMNAWINTPDLVSEQLNDLPTKLQFLFNGDSWSSDTGFCMKGDPLEQYREAFDSIPNLPYRSHSTHTIDELISVGQKLVSEVRSSFPKLLLRSCEQVGFFITDLESVLTLDLRGAKVFVDDTEKGKCDLALGSQALWFAFKFPWGFGTLEVSGRYEKLNRRVNKRALYFCHLYSSDIHPSGALNGLLETRVWAFWWTKRHEVLGRLLSRLRPVAKER